MAQQSKVDERPWGWFDDDAAETVGDQELLDEFWGPTGEDDEDEDDEEDW